MMCVQPLLAPFYPIMSGVYTVEQIAGPMEISQLKYIVVCFVTPSAKFLFFSSLLYMCSSIKLIAWPRAVEISQLK